MAELSDQSPLQQLLTILRQLFCTAHYLDNTRCIDRSVAAHELRLRTLLCLQLHQSLENLRKEPDAAIAAIAEARWIIGRGETRCAEGRSVIGVDDVLEESVGLEIHWFSLIWHVVE